MNFRKATDGLFDGVSHQDLAEALGVSIASIRQARLGPEAKAHRSPPTGWERAAIAVIKRRIVELSSLAKSLKKQTDFNSAEKT